jgi:Icc protein
MMGTPYDDHRAPLPATSGASSTASMTRRRFMQCAALGTGLLPFGRVRAAQGKNGPFKPFCFATLSDAHLYAPAINGRFAHALRRAVREINALTPRPDFVVFGGDLAQMADPAAMQLGAKILGELAMPVHMVAGEHDYFLDDARAWQSLFGPTYYSFDHHGVHFVTLMNMHAENLHQIRGMSATERMHTAAALQQAKTFPFALGCKQQAWLKKDLAQVAAQTPIVVCSHGPLYDYYSPWNFGTQDGEAVLQQLRAFENVTLLHGHTQQVLTNVQDHFISHGMVSTAWSWPYPPIGVPASTACIQPRIIGPYGERSQWDGCGFGLVQVDSSGRTSKEYRLWDREAIIVQAPGRPPSVV